MTHIAWMMWSKRGGPSGRWSLGHTLQDGSDHKTLCGLIVPDAFRYDHAGGDGIQCSKCLALENAPRCPDCEGNSTARIMRIDTVHGVQFGVCRVCKTRWCKKSDEWEVAA